MKEMKFSGNVLFGLILIAVGAISLLSGLDYFDSWHIFSTYWPLVIVLVGVKHLIDHRSNTVFGGILILLGAYLQMEKLNLWRIHHINIKELLIPVLIILVGVYFILPKKSARKIEEKQEVKAEADSSTTINKADDETNNTNDNMKEETSSTHD